MFSSDSGSVSHSWNQEYRRGRYRSEPPIPFVNRILDVLRDRAEIKKSRGLYVGCGNGRNYVPLLDAGLNLFGLDVSLEALRQLKADHPHISPRLIHADFNDFESASPFGYIISIQVFQHGTEEMARSMFFRAADLLKKGGLLFVRVNSASSQVYYSHQIIERTDLGGFTVRYEEGPKAGLAVHFLSLNELEDMLRQWFTVLEPVAEQVMPREAPKYGSWAQWESVWVRR